MPRESLSRLKLVLTRGDQPGPQGDGSRQEGPDKDSGLRWGGGPVPLAVQKLRKLARDTKNGKEPEKDDRQK